MILRFNGTNSKRTRVKIIASRMKWSRRKSSPLLMKCMINDYKVLYAKHLIHQRSRTR